MSDPGRTMGTMNTHDVFADFALRPVDSAKRLPRLSVEQLNAHPAGHPNSVAWLLWHSGREADVQLASLTGEEEIWGRYREQLGLGELGDGFGFGHSAEEAAKVVVEDQGVLVNYLEDVMTALAGYVGALSEAELDEIVDEAWDPPVSRGVRIVSIIDDAIQHVGQAAYAAGALTA